MSLFNWDSIEETAYAKVYRVNHLCITPNIIIPAYLDFANNT